MSSFAQTYLLASKVKQKLTKEAVNPNANLRVLVCQANLLDNLMDSLQHKKPLPNFPSISVSSIKIEEEDEDEDEEDEDYVTSSDSSSDEDEDYLDEFDEEDGHYTIGFSNLSSPTNITTTELSDDEEEVSDLEDYEVNDYTYSMRIIEASDDEASDEDVYSSDSSISSDEDLNIKEEGAEVDTPPSSPDDDLFISLSKLSSYSNLNNNFKISTSSVESDLPSLTHCSSISSDDSVDEYNASDDEGAAESHYDRQHHQSVQLNKVAAASEISLVPTELVC